MKRSKEMLVVKRGSAGVLTVKRGIFLWGFQGDLLPLQGEIPGGSAINHIRESPNGGWFPHTGGIGVGRNFWPSADRSSTMGFGS